MIISFDGNVFTGKTTIINKLSLANPFNIIAEHSVFLNQIPKDELYNDYMDEQIRYIKVDELRMQKIRKEINLLDRSFVSMSAHVYALFKLNLADIRSLYIKELKKFLDNKKIIIPDKYIHVACPYNIAKLRFSKNRNRATDRMYIGRKYFEAVNKFDSSWVQSVDGLTINTCDKRFKTDDFADFIISKNSGGNKLNNEQIISLTSEIMELQ